MAKKSVPKVTGNKFGKSFGKKSKTGKGAHGGGNKFNLIKPQPSFTVDTNPFKRSKQAK